MYKGRMTIELSNHEVLSDPELLVEVRRLAGQERKATARSIAALGELDARRLYLGEGCSSLFTYCTQILHLSEHAAYGRIEAARAARRWPAILDLLADGSVHLTAIGLLAPHLTTENHQRVLGSARHKTKREIEEIVASLRPQPPVASSVRKLPAPKATAVDHSAAPSLAPAVPDAQRRNWHACSPQRASEAACGGEAARAGTLQSAVHCLTGDVSEAARGAGSPEAPTAGRGSRWIFDRALTLLLEELRKTKHAAGRRPRTTTGCASHGRDIPASVKRDVWARDGGQCAFVGAAGRCTERGFLEWHTSSHLPTAARRARERRSFAAAPTTPMKRSGGLGSRRRICFGSGERLREDAHSLRRPRGRMCSACGDFRGLNHGFAGAPTTRRAARYTGLRAPGRLHNR